MKRALVYFSMVCSLIKTISGCTLYAPEHVIGYTGRSVVLSCYCIDGGAVKSVRWFLLTVFPKINIWTYPGKVDYRYRGRAVFSNDTTDFSLHLSHLTQRDKGTYRCETDRQYKDIRLEVEDPGCVLSEAGPKTITGFTRGSVVLPCVCTDVQRKPKQVKWTADPAFVRTVIFPERNAPRNSPYKGRVKLLNSISPGNLSLRISRLALMDGITYRCEVDGRYRDITLKVQDESTSIATPGNKATTPGNGNPSYGAHNRIYMFVAIAVALVVTVCGAALFYCKFKSKRNVHVESGEEKQTDTKEQEEQAADLETYATVYQNEKDAHSAKYPTVDDSQKDTDSMTYSTANCSKMDADSVLYSTVNHKENGRSTAKNAKRQIQSEESTEYAAIKVSQK